MNKYIRIKQSKKTKVTQLFNVCLSFFFITIASFGIMFISTPVAHADMLDRQPVQIAKSSSVGNLEQKAKKALNETVGSGTSEQIEGRIEQTKGKIQRETGKITGQVEGAVKQAKGKAQEDIGKVKEKSAKVSSEVKDTSEGIFEKVEDFFGN